MHTLRKLTTALLVAAGFAIAAPSLTFAETSVTVENTGKHHYVYYADHEIYYAPDTKVYYWRSGDRWESGATLPEADRTYVTAHGYPIDLDTEHPYDRHEWVIKHYRDHDDHD
jgi:hypothetical protein